LGIPEDYSEFVKFPYKARSLTNRKDIIFNSIECIEDEMVRLINNTEKESDANIGQVLYASVPHFANLSKLATPKAQLLITKYKYCKSTNTPPYPSLALTPATLVDDFMHIEDEINAIRAEQREEKNGN